MIHLQLLHTTVTDSSPVSNLISTIWPNPYAFDARHATKVDGLDEPTGDVFAIVYTPARGYQSRVIGITGFFRGGDDPTAVYLRWTGVTPAFRRNGYVREALAQLKMIIRAANPDIASLIELVPDNEYGRTVVMPAFEKLGFVRDDTIPVPAGEDADWPVVPYTLNIC